MTDRQHHRPTYPGAKHFEAIEGAADPAELSEAADRAATALVRGARDHTDADLVARVVHLADSEGLETLAQLWAGAAADSLAGALWRLYLLRSWVYADPLTAAAEYERGRRHVPVGEVVSGVVDPSGPDAVRELLDEVLAGVVSGDFADTLLRAAAFARVVAAGRVHDEPADAPATSRHGGSTYASDVAASRLVTLADQLDLAARLELAGALA